MSQFTFYANRPTENYHKIDFWFLAATLLLWGLGIFTLFVCSQNYGDRAFGDSLYFLKRQLVSSLVGFVVFFGFLITDIKYIKKLISVIVIASIVLCILTYIPPLGLEINGARRWLRMPGNFNFQPSELAKFGLVMFIANYFEKQEEIDNPDDKNVFPCVIGLVVFIGIIIGQKDFSTGVFVAIIGILMFFVTGAKLKWLIPFLIIAIPAGFLMVSLEPYRLRRLIGWIRPDQFGSTVNYQSIAAKRAISAGGFWGNGIGTGLTRINSIPEIQADYIFAGWTEAMGFIGVIIYFVLLLFFAWRGYRTAMLCKDRFSAYTTFGCVSIIFLQSILNTMVVCGLLPSTGIPLPFFSLGGSSIIVTLAMCGFMINASRCEEIDEKSIKNDEINIETLTYL